MHERRIEEASLNAWPALNSLLYDGWVLRFADGYTKRANSATPLYTGEMLLEAKIDFCESVYREQNLPPIFRLTSLANIQDLDVSLAAREYEAFDHTNVQGLALADKVVARSERTRQLDLGEWLEHFHHLTPGRPDSHTHEAILQRIIGSVCPMVLVEDGEVLACGLGVLHDDYFGLFDIVTAASERRKGYGRELTESLLAWAQEHSACTAYLQVMQSNTPAQRLYEQLGFVEAYRYWYRAPAEEPTG